MVEKNSTPLQVGVASLMGIPIYYSPYALKRVEVQRTLRERLFSWPWRPWVATRWEERPACFIFERPCLVMGRYRYKDKGLIAHVSFEGKLIDAALLAVGAED